MLAALSSPIVPWNVIVLPTPGASTTSLPFMMNKSEPAAAPAAPPLLLDPPSTALFSKIELPLIVSPPPARTKTAPP